MNKIYAIIWEDKYSDGDYTSGLCYVFDTLEKAKRMLQEMKKEDLEQYDTKNIDITETETSIFIDFIDGYSKYEIIEEEVR